MSKKTLKGAMIAGAVASLFAAGHAFADTKADTSVKCAGTNSCQGKGSCSGAKNSCKGQNACKGQGWENAKNEKACTKKGGHVVTADAK